MFEAAERPATEPAPRLDALMMQAITEVRKGREIVQHDIRRRGDLLELVMWASRLGETEKAIREAAIFAAVTEQLAAVPEQLAAVPEPAPARNRRHACPPPS